MEGEDQAEEPDRRLHGGWQDLLCADQHPFAGMAVAVQQGVRGCRCRRTGEPGGVRCRGAGARGGGQRPAGERVITSRPRYGERIAVETPTSIHALLEFAGGAVVSFAASWDVWAHGHAPMELYGEEGSVYLPDPSYFGGEVDHTERAKSVRQRPAWDHPFSRPNQKGPRGMLANYRGVGLADMVAGILEDRPHRCSPAFALHVVDVMTGIMRSARAAPLLPCTRAANVPPPWMSRRRRHCCDRSAGWAGGMNSAFEPRSLSASGANVEFRTSLESRTCQWFSRFRQLPSRLIRTDAMSETNH